MQFIMANTFHPRADIFLTRWGLLVFSTYICKQFKWLIFSVADIPGLINGAHKNYGLGYSFLRHIERCLCLLFVLDLSIDEPWSQLESLQYELEHYLPGLSKRPHAIIGNKLDIDGAEDNLKLLQERLDLPIFPVSAKHRINIKPLLLHLRELYDKHVQEMG